MTMRARGHVEACKTCGADIRWAISEKGRMMPFDAEPNGRGQWRLRTQPGSWVPVAVHVPEDERDGYHHELLISHFASCPDADHHRRPKL